MKRILYVLIACFALSFSATANSIDSYSSEGAASNLVNSFPCDPSFLTLGPIVLEQGAPPDCADYTISVPTVSGCWWTTLNGFYSFVVTDAIGTTVAFVPNTLDTTISVTLPQYGQYFVHVQYSYVDVNGVGQSVTVALDFYYDGCEIPCPPSSLSLGPISVVQGPTMHCSDFVISVPPISGCPWGSVNGSYSILVYEGTNMNYPVAGNANILSNSIDVKLGFEGNYTVVVEFHYTDINGVSHTLTESLSFLFDNCDCNYIEAPSTIDCEVVNSGIIIGTTPVRALEFTWNEPNNAAGYEYEAVTDDPNCCADGGSTFFFSGSLSRFATISFLGAPCLSFRVRAVCADGTTKSEWSDWVCSCSFDDEMRDDELGEKSFVQVIDEGLQLLAVPNPAKNYVDVIFTGISTENILVQPELIIQNASGKEVYRSSMHFNETKRVDLSSFGSGVYIIKVQDNGMLISTERLVVE